MLAIRVSFGDVAIESSAAYFDRLLLFKRQFWEQQTEGAVTLDHPPRLRLHPAVSHGLLRR